MPISLSAKKSLRTSNCKRVYNLRRKAKIDVSRKTINKLLRSDVKDIKTINDAVSKYFSALDKAVKTNYIHLNKSSRLKSRMIKRINKVLTPSA